MLEIVWTALIISEGGQREAMGGIYIAREVSQPTEGYSQPSELKANLDVLFLALISPTE